MYTVHTINIFDYTTNTPNEYYPYVHGKRVNITGWDAARNQFSKDEPNQPFNGIIDDADIEQIIKRASSNISEPEQYLHQKTVNKYYAARGGTFSEATGIKNVAEYYTERHVDYKIMRHVREVSLQFMILTRSDTRIAHPYIKEYGELLQQFKGDHRSNGGLTHPEDRREEEAAYDGCLQAWQDPLVLDPIRGGNRRCDGKVREIHIDSFANYFREAAVFSKVFEFVRNSGWNHTYDVKALSAGFIHLNAKDSYGGDYELMDAHFGEESAIETGHMLCDWTHIPWHNRGYMMDMIHELFHMKLVFGNKVYQGKNNLWSGIYPTHELESPQNEAILITNAIDLGYQPIYLDPDPLNWPKLKSNQVAVIVCGDDSLVFFGRELSDSERRAFELHHAELAAGFGQKLELTKTQWGRLWNHFCKRTYALRAGIASYKYYADMPGVPVPKYAVLKSVCALRHPERIPQFPNKSDLVIWFCSIMDNSYGNMDWKGTVIDIMQHNPELFKSFNYDDPVISEETLAILKEDWWLSNYGKLDLPNSPTFNLVKTYITKLN